MHIEILIYPTLKKHFSVPLWSNHRKTWWASKLTLLSKYLSLPSDQYPARFLAIWLKNHVGVENKKWRHRHSECYSSVWLSPAVAQLDNFQRSRNTWPVCVCSLHHSSKFLFLFLPTHRKMVNFFPEWCVLNIVVITLNAFIIILHCVAGNRKEARKEHWMKSRWMKASVLLFKRWNKVSFSQQFKPASQLILLELQEKVNTDIEKIPPALTFKSPMMVRWMYRKEIALHCWEARIPVLSVGIAHWVATAGLFPPSTLFLGQGSHSMTYFHQG